MIARGPELVEREPAQVGVVEGREPEKIVDLTLEPTRRERSRRERGEPRVVGRDRDEHDGERREGRGRERVDRSEEHTSELQSQSNLVCRLLLEKKKSNPRRAARERPQLG